MPDTDLLKEAADWAMTLQYDAPSDADRQAFERWRTQSSAHERAWERAQAVFHAFDQVTAGLGKGAIESLECKQRRRRRLRVLGMLLAAPPAAWLAWRHAPWHPWSADVATATGERKTLRLPDGSRLVLNTASAVDIAFTSAQRRIRLVAGEILVTTHADPSATPRPFLVDTAYGSVRTLGTRFSMRQLEDKRLCRVAVFEHAVEVRPLAGAARILHAGEQADFDVAGVRLPVVVDQTAALWERGTLLAKDMPLGAVIAELARYRPGVLRCDPAVASMLVSGALSVADTDAALELLAGSLPLHIERRTRYWVRVGRRE
ncbi:MAG: FecR family protein [Burkholderiaceae bacterium]